MTYSNVLRWAGSGAAVLLMVVGVPPAGRAADETPARPAAPGGAPVAVAACPTCQGAPVGGPCQTCGLGVGVSPLRKMPHCKTHYVTQLRPGACFGYFQTQWNRWDEVCPLPYQGVGQSDAPPPPTPAPADGVKPMPKPGDAKPNEKAPMTPPGMGTAPIPTLPPLPQPVGVNRGRQ